MSDLGVASYTLSDLDELRGLVRETIAVEHRGSFFESERAVLVEERLRTWMRAGVSVLQGIAHLDRVQRREARRLEEERSAQERRELSCGEHEWSVYAYCSEIVVCDKCGRVQLGCGLRLGGVS